MSVSFPSLISNSMSFQLVWNLSEKRDSGQARLRRTSQNDNEKGKATCEERFDLSKNFATTSLITAKKMLTLMFKLQKMDMIRYNSLVALPLSPYVVRQIYWARTKTTEELILWTIFLI